MNLTFQIGDYLGYGIIISVILLIIILAIISYFAGKYYEKCRQDKLNEKDVKNG